MNETNYSELVSNLLPAFGETLEMCGIALVLAIVLGIPIGVLSYLTSGCIVCKNKIINLLVNLILNIIRIK